MKIRLLAIGSRMPSWVNDGFQEYQKRLPPQCALQLVEIRAAPRAGNADIARAVQTEGDALLSACRQETLIALERRGQQWDTETLARQMDGWLHAGRDVALLVGGPDGLSTAVLDKVDCKWSLSSLTLPHPLVRVVVAEQLYRAWSILQGGPYHRSG